MGLDQSSMLFQAIQSSDTKNIQLYKAHYISYTVDKRPSNYNTIQGLTALGYAIYKGDQNNVQQFIGELDFLTTQSLKFQAMAINHGSVDVVLAPGSNYLLLCVLRDYYKLAQYLIDLMQKDTKLQQIILQPNKAGFNLLHCLVMIGQQESIDLIEANRALIESMLRSKTDEGWTFVHFLVYFKRLIVKTWILQLQENDPFRAFYFEIIQTKLMELKQLNKAKLLGFRWRIKDADFDHFDAYFAELNEGAENQNIEVKVEKQEIVQNNQLLSIVPNPDTQTQLLSIVPDVRNIQDQTSEKESSGDVQVSDQKAVKLLEVVCQSEPKDVKELDTGIDQDNKNVLRGDCDQIQNVQKEENPDSNDMNVVPVSGQNHGTHSMSSGTDIESKILQGGLYNEILTDVEAKGIEKLDNLLEQPNKNQVKVKECVKEEPTSSIVPNYTDE